MCNQLRILCLFDDDLNEDASFRFRHFLSIIKKDNNFGTPHVCVKRINAETFEYKVIEKYHIIFLFGKAATKNTNSVDLQKNTHFLNFMKKGGGVFGTGDHANLGSALCGDVPRLRNMREWFSNPNTNHEDRLSTLRYDKSQPHTANEKDKLPQRLHLFYDTDSLPHPLLQIPLGIPGLNREIQFFPDHPHEGECQAPVIGDKVYDKTITFLSKNESNKETKVTAREFPVNIVIEPVAKAMSSGGKITRAKPHPAISCPRDFLAISAFDGHKLKTPEGRIAADATWHHFLDMNLKGFHKHEILIEEISRYYVNIVEWLAPPQFQLMLKEKALRKAIKSYPFSEEIGDLKNVNIKLGVLYVGKLMKETLRNFMTETQIYELTVHLVKTRPEIATLIEKAHETSIRQSYFSANELIQDSILGHATLRLRLEDQYSLYDKLNEIKQELSKSELDDETKETLVKDLQKCENNDNVTRHFLSLVSHYNAGNSGLVNYKSQFKKSKGMIDTVDKLYRIDNHIIRKAISDIGDLASMKSEYIADIPSEIDVLEEFEVEFLNPILSIYK